MAKSLALLIAIAGCGGGDNSRHIMDAPSIGGDVKADAPATSAPDYIWYVLDETSGTTAKDSSSHHYDITGLTGVTWGSGAHFDGTGGGGSVPVDTSYRTTPLTLSAWLTPTTRTDETSIVGPLQPYPSNAFGDDIPAEFGFGLGLNVWSDGTPGSALTVEGLNGCAPGATFPVDCSVGTPAFAANTEYFIAASISATTAEVYVNGVAYAAATTGTLATDVTQFWLGQHNNDTSYGTKRFYAGSMRDVRVYKRELPASEIAALYAAGPTLVAP